MAENIKFVLNGCDIRLIAEAPCDITLEQLLKQCDKIKPSWCACGIYTLSKADYPESAATDVVIGYDSVKVAHDDANCRIEE